MWITRIALLFLATVLTACAGSVTSEFGVGDFSNDYTHPTFLNFSEGVNLVFGTFGSADLDFIAFTVPEGSYLNSIANLQESNPDLIPYMFLELGSGIGFLSQHPPQSFGGQPQYVDHVLGAVGINVDLLGVNMMPILATSLEPLGVPQFWNSPLGPGDYSIWLQGYGSPGQVQLYELEVIVGPEPGMFAPVIAALAIFSLMLLRRQRTER